ncbi:MAG: hypothetical protein PHI19_02550 [Clostridia bacterium]|nr:hypothetical protein [Clostridia bacterium]
MKKKVLSILLLAVLVIALSVSIAACDEDKNENALICTVMLVDAQNNEVATFELETESKYLSGAIEELAANPDNKVSFNIKDGYICTYIYNDTVYGNAANSDYVMLFTGLNDADLMNVAWGTVTVDNKVYFACAYGIEEMPIKEDAVYVIAIQHLEY